MTFAYTFDELIKCGGVRVVFEHCRELNKRGHQATIYCRHINDSTKDWVEKYRVPVRKLDNRPAEPVDVLISCWWPMLDELLAFPAKRRFHLVQGRDRLSYAAGHAWHDLIEVAMHRTDYDYLAVSAWAGDSCRLPKIVPNGVDTAFFHPATFAKLFPTIRILLEASSVDEYKGLVEAVEVVKRIKTKNKVECWLINRFGPTGIDSGVVDHYVTDPNDVTISSAYQNSTIMLKTTWFDGFGLPHLEAMASGLPLVTTNAGGNMEFCRHDINCLVAPVKDIDTLTNEVQSLIDSKPLRDRLMQNGMLTAKKWTWERSVDKLLDAVTIK